MFKEGMVFMQANTNVTAVQTSGLLQMALAVSREAGGSDREKHFPFLAFYF